MRPVSFGSNGSASFCWAGGGVEEVDGGGADVPAAGVLMTGVLMTGWRVCHSGATGVVPTGRGCTTGVVAVGCVLCCWAGVETEGLEVAAGAVHVPGCGACTV
ncbi:MAG: hypothetical protein RRA15_08490 [bacterium]|nr:hypothetical protein [bacterium]MDT8366518.1 hypothetical protein [bacterium]